MSKRPQIKVWKTAGVIFGEFFRNFGRWFAAALVPWLLGTVIFIQILLIIELVSYAVRMFRYPDRAEVRKRLRNSLVTATDVEDSNITKNKVFSDIPYLNQFLVSVPGVERLDLLMCHGSLSESSKSAINSALVSVFFS